MEETYELRRDLCAFNGRSRGFWGEQAAAIDWYKPWDKVLDDSRKPFYRWFAGAELNTCYNALDRHVEKGRADQAALIYDSPVTDTRKTYTFGELRDAVAQFAGCCETRGWPRVIGSSSICR